jgi:hypothetical protein
VPELRFLVNLPLINGFTGPYASPNLLFAEGTGAAINISPSTINIFGADQGNCPGGDNTVVQYQIAQNGTLKFDWSTVQNDINFDFFRFGVSNTSFQNGAVLSNQFQQVPVAYFRWMSQRVNI